MNLGVDNTGEQQHPAGVQCLVGGGAYLRRNTLDDAIAAQNVAFEY